jgi:xanthine/uracil permease
MVAIMVLGLIIVFINRSFVKNEKGNRVGFSTRSIQFLGVCFVFPVAIILSLSGKLESGALTTLLGTVVGYVLSGLGEST